MFSVITPYISWDSVREAEYTHTKLQLYMCVCVYLYTDNYNYMQLYAKVVLWTKITYISYDQP